MKPTPLVIGTSLLLVALGGAAAAAPCLDATALLDGARLSRDSHDGLYDLLRVHDAQLDRLVDAYVMADDIPDAHRGLGGRFATRALLTGRRCEGGLSLGQLDRRAGSVLADSTFGRSNLDVVLLAQWQSIEVAVTDLAGALGLTRTMLGGRITYRDVLRVVAAYVGADQQRGAQSLAIDGLGTDHFALGFEVPRYGVGADLLVDTEGQVTRARLLSSALPLPVLDGVAYLSTGWRQPSDEFFLRAELLGIGQLFVAGIDVVPTAAELRTAWIGLAHDWQLLLESTATYLYVGLDAQLSTFGSAAVRAINDGERAMGAQVGFEGGFGTSGVQFGLTATLGYNTPANLEALPTLTDQFEVGATTLLRFGW